MTGTITVTIAGAPTASTGEASAVSETAATLHGTVNPQGKPTTYYFNYGTSTVYGQKTTEQTAGEGSLDEPVLAGVSSLLPGTTYHVQLVAKHTSGTTLGADETFTTQGAPMVTTGSATAVGETQATLNATVNPDGQTTTYVFEWGTSSTYGQTTAELPAGEDHSGHLESATLTGLSASTVYHFRLVAKNASGTVTGGDEVFPTASPSATTTTSGGSARSATQSSTTPAATIAPLAPIEGPSASTLLGSPVLRSTQRGFSVRGSLEVSQADAGRRLEVDLLATSASLATARRSRAVRVGRLVRASVSAGKVSFSVALNARGQRALMRHHRLPLTVKITLTPTSGAPFVVTRTITLRV
jgi:hypothetical protein